jgi:hypothetical protein
MIIQTHKILGLWFVKNPYRRDLDTFCTEINDVIKTINSTTMTSYEPIVYECQFWLQTPKFKKLTKTQLKKLLGFELSEKKPGPKDRNFYNASEKWERAYLPKRKTTARTYTKKKTLAASDKPILNKTQMRRFLSWIRQGNATQIEPGIWLEQTTQGMQEFTYEELQKFFKKEYT